MIVVACPTATAVTRPFVVAPPVAEARGCSRSMSPPDQSAHCRLRPWAQPSELLRRRYHTPGSPSRVTVTVLTGASVTVIEDVPVFVSLVAVIVRGRQRLTAVTRPFPSTVATAGLLETHETTRPASTLPFTSLSVSRQLLRRRYSHYQAR